jgi:hypothetical protein
MKRFLFIGLIILSQIALGQTASEKLIYGKILVGAENSEGVTIVNLVNEKTTISDSQGVFYILAKVEDVLIFSSVNLDYYRKIIEIEDLKPDLLIIKMTPKVTELKEVIINKNPEINAVSLGISPRGIIQFTPAERKLATASSSRLNPQGLDPLINSISGRTAMLKKELEAEKKWSSINQIDNMFKEEYFRKTLKIPAAYIKGFEYYIVENQRFTTVLKSKNKTQIEFAMVFLAEKYNAIILNEK